MPLKTTAGQVLLNEALPEELRDYGREMTGGNLRKLMTQVAQNHPDKYRDVSYKLMQMGAEYGYHSGGYSFGLKHLLPSPIGQHYRRQIQADIDKTLERTDLSPEDKEKEIIRVTGRQRGEMEKAIFDEQVKAGNPLAIQASSGVKGGPGNIRSLLGSDLLYVDNHDRDVPLPVMESYAEGLSPSSYLAGAYGARRGVTDVKRGTAQAGFLSKRLVQAAHRLIVTGHDSDKEPSPTQPRGLPVSIDDQDNEGSLLAAATGGYPRNTPLTTKVISDLRNRGHKELLLRSPAVGGPPDGGLYARDVGIREFSRLPHRGEFIGTSAAQSVGERVGQGALGSKHLGGVSGAGKTTSGFKLLDQMTQIPSNYPGSATHAQLDGYVDGIDAAPQGGHYVSVGGERHYVPSDRDLKVKRGDEIEAGDALSSGLNNPAELVRHKGIGEGRKRYLESFQEAASAAGYGTHRRNVEVLARGLIDHVRLTKMYGDHLPGDVISYSALEHSYKPRTGYETLSPKQAIGKYLETPVLHHAIGEKVRKSMLPLLEKHGVGQLTVHAKPPPFEPEMIRSQDIMSHDPDWQSQMLGSNLERNLLRGAHTGATSDRHGTSYVPALAEGLHFGLEGKTKTGAAKAFDIGGHFAAFPKTEHLPQLPKVNLPHLGDAHQPIPSDDSAAPAAIPAPAAPTFATPSIQAPVPLHISDQDVARGKIAAHPLAVFAGKMAALLA